MDNKLNVFFHNSLAFALEALRQPPQLCYARRGQSVFCDGCEAGDTFTCLGCKKLMPYCMGADDEYFDFCDNCTNTLVNSREAASL